MHELTRYSLHHPLSLSPHFLVFDLAAANTSGPLPLSSPFSFHLNIRAFKLLPVTPPPSPIPFPLRPLLSTCPS